MSVVKKCFRLIQLKQHFDKKGYPEREVIAYLKSWNNKLKSDEYGNLFLINPGTPLLNAHMDTVQSEQCVKNLDSLRLKNWMIGCTKPAVIWGDDKCWIAIAMEIYEKLWNKVSLLFTRQEETWMNWAREFVAKHSDLLSECKYCLTLDRRGGWDIIGYDNSYCSKEFQDEVYRLTKEFGYKPTKWFASDANHISKVLNCVNLSVGYYNPHQKTEFIKCDELENALEATMYLVQHLEDDYPIYKAPVYWSVKLYSDSKYTQKSLYDYWPADDDDDDDDYYERLRKRWNSYRKADSASNNEYFEYKDWMLTVKKDIFLTDINDYEEFFEIPKWMYAVCDYDAV